MSLPAWPKLLPAPLVSFSGSASGSVVRTEMETGYVRQRQRFETTVETWKVGFVFDPLQLVLFKGFFEVETNLGAAFFGLPMDLGEGLQTYKVRAVGGYSQTLEQGAWRVSFVIETYENEEMSSPEAYAFSAALGPELYEFDEKVKFTENGLVSPWTDALSALNQKFSLSLKKTDSINGPRMAF